MKKSIYHYCSLETFSQIVKNKTIRLSDLNKTNDYMEKKWGKDLLYGVLCDELKRNGPEFWLLRKLQQYSVSVRKWDFEQLRKQGTVTEYTGIFILEDGRCYDKQAGLVLDGAWVEELLLVE